MCFIFFFKQKTAYEMRISDWSSDVCSSDLLVDDLVLTAEDVRVVLRELAHAHQPVERAVRLVAVAAAILVNAQRQVAIALDPLFEDQNMRRAVHRLERHPFGGVRYQRAFVPSTEARRVGNECVSPGISRGSPQPSKNK